MTPREQVLATIRRSLGVTGEERPRRAVVEERLSKTPSGVLPQRGRGKSDGELRKLFVEMAQASAATVDVVRSPADAPAAIADYLRGRNLALRLRHGEDPRVAGLDWRAAAVETATGRSFGDDETGVSAAFAAVAETGTLMLLAGADNPTTLNFLPDTHIVLIEAGDVAATYEDVWARLRESRGPGVMPRVVNWITGPSRSADIEQILLMGAHGPRRLHIVLIDPTGEARPDETAAAAPAGSTPSPAVVRSTLEADTPEGGSDADEDKRKDDPEKEDRELDEELDESFPASDPPSQTQP